MTVGTGAHTVRMAKFEYVDDAALIDEDAGQGRPMARVTLLAAGYIAGLHCGAPLRMLQ